MTIQEKKTELYRYRKIIECIDDLKVKREEIFTQSTKITSVNSDMPGSPNINTSSKVENGAIKLAELDKRIELLQIEFNRLIGAIRRVQNPRYRELLSMVYVDGMNLKEVTKEFKKSYKNIQIMHRRALDKLEL